jgi:hypothetical protein
MANLLPYTLLVAQALKARHPDKTVVLGGTGPTAVERTSCTGLMVWM